MNFRSPDAQDASQAVFQQILDDRLLRIFGEVELGLLFRNVLNRQNPIKEDIFLKQKVISKSSTFMSSPIHVGK